MYPTVLEQEGREDADEIPGRSRGAGDEGAGSDLASDRLASPYAAKQQYREALEEWLTIVKWDRRFKDDGARKMMLQIFELIDPRSPLAEEYREKLAQVSIRERLDVG